VEGVHQMSHATILGTRSLVMGVFAMVHAFWPLTRGDNSVYAFAAVAIVIGVLHCATARVVEGSARTVWAAVCVVTIAVAFVALGSGIGGGLLPLPVIVAIFGVVLGALEMLGATRSQSVPRSDYLVLGGLTLMVGLASLVGPDEPGWLSGTLVAWASMTAVFAGTASVQWKDQAERRNTERTTDVGK
jgi:uncharacterized membrane protein HdeD (DUF308 family)